MEDPSQFSSEESILNLDEEGEWGYVFMVDLLYPANIHDKTSDFLLAPDSSKVTEDMFSEFMRTLFRTPIQEQRGTSTRSYPTLLLSQSNKKNDVIHFAILKFYLQMGNWNL